MVSHSYDCTVIQRPRRARVKELQWTIESGDAALARQEHRTGRIAQHVLGVRAQHHLDYPAVAVSSDEEQVGTVVLEEPDYLFMSVAGDQPEFGACARIRRQVGARLFERPLAEP